MKRPVGITLLALLIFAGAVICAIVAVFAFVGGALVANMINNPVLGKFALGGGAFLGIYALCFAGVYTITAYGLWTLRSWGRVMGIILDVLWLLMMGLALAQLFKGFSPVLLAEYIVYLLISAAILWYFFLPNVKRAFAPAP